VNGTPDEITYRSTSFAGESACAGVGDPDVTYTDFNTLVDGSFAIIRQGKEWQNIDAPISSAYCCGYDKWVAKNGVTTLADFFTWGGASQTPGGYVFDIPEFIPRKGSLQLYLNRDGTITANLDDVDFYVGTLEVSSETVAVKKAIERIINSSGMLQQ